MKLPLVIAALTCATAASADPLWEWEIDAAFVDRAFAFEWPENGEAKVGYIVYRDGGALLTRNGTEYEAVGEWRIRGNRLCMTTDLISFRGEACEAVDPVGDKYVLSNGLALLPLSDIGFLNK